ncbi:MAG: hypothetical protein IEMM0008_0577 [bacterium]|nr:MAG: hypothetical protein IEMM0008_0577 [bacterium]
MGKLIFISVLFTLLCNVSFGKTIHVLPGGDTLQQTIEKAVSGDKILISEGTYETKKPIEITRKSNLTIEGQGNVWLLCDDVNVDVINISFSKNIKLVNLKARHKKPLKEYQCHGSVVKIALSSNIHIEDCELNGCGAIGIYTINSKKIVITKNYIHKNSFTALYLSNSTDVKITYNKIMNNKSFISLSNIKYLEMYGNTIQNNRGYWEK